MNFDEDNNVDSWLVLADQQANERQNQMLSGIESGQQSVFNDYAGVVATGRQERARNLVGIQDSVASLCKLSQMGLDGNDKARVIDVFNRKYGNNGQSTLADFGFDDKGNFKMKFAQTGANGATSFSEQVATPVMQYNMALNHPGIFSKNDLMGMYKNLSNLGYSANELSNIYSNSLAGKMVSSPDSLGNRIAANGNKAGGRLIGGTDANPSSDSGARPGPRPRYWSEDDFNDTPYMQPNGEGTRYRGHGISSFSTADFAEDRASAKYPNGQWKMLSSGNTDGKGNTVTKARWENSKTGEVMELDPGESPSTAMSKMDKAKLGQVEADTRLKNAQADAGGFRPSGTSGRDYASADFWKNRESYRKELEAIDADIALMDPEADKDMIARANSQKQKIRAMIYGGSTPAASGGDGRQHAEGYQAPQAYSPEVISAAEKELARRAAANNGDGSSAPVEKPVANKDNSAVNRKEDSRENDVIQRKLDDIAKYMPNAKRKEGMTDKEFADSIPDKALIFYKNKAESGKSTAKAVGEMRDDVIDWWKDQFDPENIKRGFGAKGS